MSKPVFLVAGVGNASGTGSHAARLFARSGYTVALLARSADSLNALADEIKKEGGDAVSIPIASYSPADIASAFEELSTKLPHPQYALRVALFNSSHAVFKSFLELTPEDISTSLSVNVETSFAFARGAILSFQQNEPAENGARGTLIFTGATASTRGNVMTSAFAASKHALRALSQSLAKAYGKEGVHVAHAIIDGRIYNTNHDHSSTDADLRLHPSDIADAYLYLAKQNKSAWTWELDLRPAHEKW